MPPALEALDRLVVEIRARDYSYRTLHGLMAGLLYGTGTRLMGCVRLRVQDIDFDYAQIVVRNGKGKKDRIVPLPRRYIAALREQLARVAQIHRDDIANGFGEVWLPDALSRKYPNAGRERGVPCGKSARGDLYGGGRVTGRPTVIATVRSETDQGCEKHA